MVKGKDWSGDADQRPGACEQEDGKVSIVRGSTPLKEGVVVIKDDTTMEQLRHFARCAGSGGESQHFKSSSTVTRALRHSR